MEMNITQAWAEGGWPMYPTGLFALASIACAVVSLLGRQRTLALAAAALGALAMAMGGAGMLLGRRQVDTVIALVNPENQVLIREGGYAEANRPAQLGGACGGLGLVLGLAAVVTANRRSSN
jgi:hypothetical protein